MAFKNVVKIIKGNKKFLISSHINAEADAVGSQFALASILRRMGKRVTLVNQDSLPYNLLFLSKGLNLNGRPKGNFDVAIVLDAPELKRVGRVARYLANARLILNIDHHVSNNLYADVNWVDTKASSVGEMIFRLCPALGLKINKYEALCLYAAIMTDTGSFKYISTTSKTHQITAQLLDKGISPNRVYKNIYESNSFQDMVLLGKSLATMKKCAGGKIASITVTKQMLKSTGAYLEAAEDFVNFVRSVRGVKVAISFRELNKNEIRVSLRSHGEIDVNKIAGRFGGGGHIAASGCTIRGSLKEAERKLIKVVKEFL